VVLQVDYGSTLEEGDLDVLPPEGCTRECTFPLQSTPGLGSKQATVTPALQRAVDAGAQRSQFVIDVKPDLNLLSDRVTFATSEAAASERPSLEIHYTAP
jgi:hypothetical protein